MNIQRIGDRAAINLFSVLFAVQQSNTGITVVGMLLAFMISCLGMYLKKKAWILLGMGAYFVLSVLFPVFVLFYPVLFYEILSLQQEKIVPHGMAALVVLMAVRMGLCLGEMRILVLAGEICSFGLALWLCRNRCQMEILQEKYFCTQDNSTEQARRLKKENTYLLEKQDNEIYTATLQERNRIAREIHDNVGHMISRGILMTGALLTVAEEDTVRSGLLGLKDCLNETMTNIRQSVHDLHDDSIDLEQRIKSMFQDLSGFQVDFEYDMSQAAPREIKYSLLAIAKESLSNIIRHSSGDRVWIAVQEHPAFYNMSVADNGRCDGRERGNGIGLYNIRERVDQLSGTLHISAEKTGFQIHVSIPKKDGK